MSSGVSYNRARRLASWVPLNPWSIKTFAWGVSSKVELPRLPVPKCVMVIVMRTPHLRRGRDLNTPHLVLLTKGFHDLRPIRNDVLYEHCSITLLSNLCRVKKSEAEPLRTVSSCDEVKQPS